MGVTGGSAAAAAMLAACGGGGSSDAKPAKPADASASQDTPKGSGEKIRIGFIALTDCASVIMAKELGYFDKYGLNVEVVKQASWASTRDALLTGEIEAAHCLFGMPFSVYTGVGGQAGKELHHRDGTSTTTARRSRCRRKTSAARSATRDLKVAKAVTEVHEGQEGSHLRDDLPRWHPRHVAALLAGRRQASTRRPSRSSRSRRPRWSPT